MTVAKKWMAKVLHSQQKMFIIDSNSLPTHFKNFMPSLTFKNLNKDYPYHT